MMSVQNLLALVGQAEWATILDMRGDDEIAATPRRLPAARRTRHEELAPLASTLSGQVVVYCADGGMRAEAAAARLRAAGVRVASLEGGIAAWLAADGPTLGVSAGELGPGPSRWVTRSRPKIDRIACPWLVKRFVEAHAEFHYVAAEAVRGAAALLRATPFDIPDVAFSHEGEACSFDAFIKRFDIRDPALGRVAHIIRGADTGRLDLASECAGLLAMSLGVSASARDDETALERGLGLYDALYAWARSAKDETHAWKPARAVA